MCVFNGTSLCAALLGSTLTFKSKPANALAAPRAPARPPLRTALWRRRTAGLCSLIGKHPNGRPCKHFYLWPFSFFRKQSFDSLAGGGLADAREPRAGGSVRGGRSECAITSSSCFQLSVPAPPPQLHLAAPHLEPLSAERNKTPVSCGAGDGMYPWLHMEDKEIGKGAGGARGVASRCSGTCVASVAGAPGPRIGPAPRGEGAGLPPRPLCRRGPPPGSARCLQRVASAAANAADSSSSLCVFMAVVISVLLLLHQESFERAKKTMCAREIQSTSPPSRGSLIPI